MGLGQLVRWSVKNTRLWNLEESETIIRSIYVTLPINGRVYAKSKQTGHSYNSKAWPTATVPHGKPYRVTITASANRASHLRCETSSPMGTSQREWHASLHPHGSTTERNRRGGKSVTSKGCKQLYPIKWFASCHGMHGVWSLLQKGGQRSHFQGLSVSLSGECEGTGRMVGSGGWIQ